MLPTASLALALVLLPALGLSTRQAAGQTNVGLFDSEYHAKRQRIRDEWDIRAQVPKARAAETLGVAMGLTKERAEGRGSVFCE